MLKTLQCFGMLYMYKSRQVNTLPIAKSQTRSKQNKGMQKCRSVCSERGVLLSVLRTVFGSLGHGSVRPPANLGLLVQFVPGGFLGQAHDEESTVKGCRRRFKQLADSAGGSLRAAAAAAPR